MSAIIEKLLQAMGLAYSDNEKALLHEVGNADVDVDYIIVSRRGGLSKNKKGDS